MKKLLILKTNKDVCGDEIGLITHQCSLIGIDAEEKTIASKAEMESTIKSYNGVKEFDYLYLCTHGDKDGFDINMGSVEEEMEWGDFSTLLCTEGVLNEDSIILLACCRGGLFKVSSEIMAACGYLNFVCGVKWSVKPWDLTTGFIVFLYNIEKKLAEPIYAASKASLATDYTFVCYDRAELESNPQYERIKLNLYLRNKWIDEEGNWIEDDEDIKTNVGIL